MIAGNQPLLLNVTYIKGDKRSGTKECFEVIYRDDNGEIRKSSEPPDVDIYFTKPQYRTYDYNKPEERIDRLIKHRVPYSRIRKEIELEMGDVGKEFFKRCMENKDYDSLDEFYTWPYSFRADFEPEFYYMDEWFSRYPMPSSVKLTRAFLDVEVDQIDHPIDLDNIPNTAGAPVNCVTVLIEETRECYTFVLEPYEPKRIGYTEEDYKRRYKYYQAQLTAHRNLMETRKEFTEELESEFSKIYGKFSYHIRNYKSELELIRDVFRLINTRKPNFCLQWNMRFDIQYLIYRIRWLTGDNSNRNDVANIVCHPDFENQSCFFKVDRSTFQLEKQFDYFYCSSYTHYICQMRLYASIRKSQHALKSVSLNYISDRELRDKKVDYPQEMGIMEFMYLEWPTFIKYNIKDVLLQFGIEQKTNDTMTYYLRSMVNYTPYRKIFRETHLLRNVREKFFNQDGWVQGNNINIIALRKKWNAERRKENFNEIEEAQSTLGGVEETESSFKGAINADPIMNDNVGTPILGIPSNVLWDDVADQDMEAFYPNSKIASNMDPITLKAKAYLDNDQFISGECTNRSLNQTYDEKDKNGNVRRNDLTGEAVNTFCSGNALTFGYNWLNLPSVTEMYNLIRRK